MRTNILLTAIGALSALALVVIMSAPADAQPAGKTGPAAIPAYVNTIEGFGAKTTGGKGKPVVSVTRPADLPAAVVKAASGGGGIVEAKTRGKIAGGIRLNKKDQGNVTLKGNGCEFSSTLSMMKGVHNMIIQDVVVRKGYDGCTIYMNCHDIVIDHCSFADHGDGSVDISDGCHDVTVQWSIMADNCKPMLWKNITRASLHHCLVFNSWWRNPSLYLKEGDMRNNVIWGWHQVGTTPGTIRSGAVKGMDDSGPWLNILNNYYRTPANQRPDNTIYGQYMVSHLPKLKAKGWKMGVHIAGNDFPAGWDRKTKVGTKATIDALQANGYLLDKPYKVPPVTTHTAKEALDLVCKYAGSRPRDEYFTDIVENYVRKGKFKPAPPKNP